MLNPFHGHAGNRGVASVDSFRASARNGEVSGRLHRHMYEHSTLPVIAAAHCSNLASVEKQGNKLSRSKLVVEQAVCAHATDRKETVERRTSAALCTQSLILPLVERVYKTSLIIVSHSS